ncbi:MAG: hypothetical protein JSU72_06940 [Deltaproteobacteria bacterium]|nr:MAG: hypothetical protein JSU72_06940 [Deltaproteobacteria bacterium]
MAAGASKRVRWVCPSGCGCGNCLGSQTKVLCHDTMALVFALACHSIPTDDVAEVLVHPEEVAARMEDTAIKTHNVVRARRSRGIQMAVETSGAGVRALGEARSRLRSRTRKVWFAVDGVVHCMAAVTVGYTTIMEGQSIAAQPKGDEHCGNED